MDGWMDGWNVETKDETCKLINKLWTM